MSSQAERQQDPFYLVKEEIQDSVKKLQATFGRWEQLPDTSIQDFLDLSKELSTGCENIEWQVDELDRATAVAERYPARFGIDVEEIELRKKWTSSTHNQIFTIRKALQTAGDDISVGRSQQAGKWKEFSRLVDHESSQQSRGATRPNDNFSYEAGSLAFLLSEQDEDFDHLNDAAGRIGEVGLEIHTKMSSQERVRDDLDKNMGGKLGFVQKRITTMWTKASWRARVSTIVALAALALILLTFLAFNA